jgi:predicted CDP-diglyceride synthetase/phosphatidate cytidylyltransferase
LRKAWSRPHEDHLAFFALGAVRIAFIIVALETYSWTTLLIPVAVVLLLRCAVVPKLMAVGPEIR